MLPFEFDPHRSVPSSPWSPMAPQNPSMTDVMQALQTIEQFQRQNFGTALVRAASFSVLQQNLSQQQSNKMPEVSRKVFVGGLPADGDKRKLI